MPPKFASFLCACSLLLGLARTAFATEAVPAYPELVTDDIKYVLTAPSRWERPEWQNFGWATLAIAGTGVIADRPWRDAMRRQSGNIALVPDTTPGRIGLRLAGSF
jgi:hypothetical protein